MEEEKIRDIIVDASSLLLFAALRAFAVSSCLFKVQALENLL